MQDTKKKKSKMCTQQVVVQRTSADGAEGGRLWMNEEVKACGPGGDRGGDGN